MNTKMYWWNLNALENDLAGGTLSEPQAVKYLLATTAVTIFGLSMGWAAENEWVRLAAITVSVCGILFCYHSNGGADGKDFLARYFSLSWVVSIRLLPWIALVFFVVGIIQGVREGLHSTAPSGPIYMRSFSADFPFFGPLVAAVIYLRLAMRLAKLRQRSTSPIEA